MVLPHPLPLVNQYLCQCLAIPNSLLFTFPATLWIFVHSLYFTLSAGEVVVKINPHTLC